MKKYTLPIDYKMGENSFDYDENSAILVDCAVPYPTNNYPSYLSIAYIFVASNSFFISPKIIINDRIIQPPSTS